MKTQTFLKGSFILFLSALITKALGALFKIPLTMLLGGEVSSIGTLFTPFTAVVFLVFVLLYTPCVAAIATVKREMGSTRAAITTALTQCVIAWLIAFAVRCVGLAFGLV